MKPVAKLAAGLGAVVALAVVFAAYLHPDLAVGLATQLWNCF